MRTDLNRSGTAVLASLLLLSATGVAAGTMTCQWAASAVPSADLRDQRQRANELETARVDGLARLDLNLRVLDDLVGGRCSFAEAITLRMQTNQGMDSFWTHLRVMYPGAADDRERVARILVMQVELLAEHNPGRYDHMVSHVHDELAAMGQRTDDSLGRKSG